MHPKDYRAQYAEGLERDRAARSARARRVAAPASWSRSSAMRRRTGADRLAAIREASSFDPLSKPSVIKAWLQVLSTPGGTRRSPAGRADRAAAVQRADASISGPTRPTSPPRLRTATGSDDQALREQAMDILALYKDPYVQEMLADGLRNPQTAMVAPERALRMLGYDVHGEYYPLLHDIVEGSRKPQLRRMALRLLAADSGAKDTFARIAADRDDDPVARSTSAVALQSLAPQEFDSLAKTIVADDDDDDGVRATMLNALAHNPDDPDEPTLGVARAINASAQRSPQLKAAARDYLRQSNLPS